jgi:hypothetical protein
MAHQNAAFTGNFAMLHYKNRADKLHILTLDRCLLEDIDQRLDAFAGLSSIERVTPGRGDGAIAPDDILALARDTVTSRVLIMDVRNHTLPQLQRAYSDIIRFNRPDFNSYCYTVLVGDGPRDFLHPSRGKKTLRAFLADLRINYSPAAFFGDPFLFYSSDELQAMALARNFLPERLSLRFEKYFRDETPSIPQLRRYFRAADKPEDEKATVRRERRKALKKLIVKIILDEFPEDKDLVRQALSKKGYAVGGESVRCHIYPFYFEQHVLDCFCRAKEAS